MKLFAVRGSLRARQKKWCEAEEDLRAAIETAERETESDPTILKALLMNHALILRKLHRDRQASAVEERARSAGNRSPADTIVDITQLTGEFKRGKK